MVGVWAAQRNVPGSEGRCRRAQMPPSGAQPMGKKTCSVLFGPPTSLFNFAGLGWLASELPT